MQSKQPGIHLVLTRVVMNAASLAAKPAELAAELAKITTVPQLTEAALLAAHWAIRGPVTQLAPGVSVALWVQHVRPAVPLCAPLSAALSVLPHPEQQYLELVARVLATGEARDDRTGVGTRAVFGARLEFSLADNVMPVLTTKRVFWKGVVHELLWFLRGCTDARALSAAGVRIWDGNASRAALDARGLTDRAEGDLGPVYGFQWRHFGAPYVTADTDYRGAGVDQIKALVHGLRTDPVGRRHILSAWNPADLPAMALPPCHILAQFWIGADGLSCQMYQRSADLGLGVPFNIASYALLTHLLAACVGRPAARLIMVFGDTHIYSTHEEALREQLTRRPRSFPKLELKRSSGAGEGTSATLPDMDTWVVADIVLNNYNPHPPMPMPMAV
jgi:thymidylate synthase